MVASYMYVYVCVLVHARVVKVCPLMVKNRATELERETDVVFVCGGMLPLCQGPQPITHILHTCTCTSIRYHTMYYYQEHALNNDYYIHSRACNDCGLL